MACGTVFALLMLTLLASLLTTLANQDAKRLYEDLLVNSGYNRLIRPVANSSDAVYVKIGLKFTQLVRIDERNEVVVTTMWMMQEWYDASLTWDPAEYGGVTQLYVPSEMLWLPDIVLYNNADGDYTITYMTKLTINYHGKIVWVPPATFKTQCDINVRYFPFDEQHCKLKFGSWTYDGYLVDVRHLWLEKYGLSELEWLDPAMDMSEYYPSVEWDILHVKARKTIAFYPCCDEPYPDVTFHLRLRRKTLYYTINIIIPCVALNMLTCFAFYMPCDCGEKLSLEIEIFLALSLFQMLLMEALPATSTSFPLFARFILFTNIMVALGIFNVTMVVRKYFQQGGTDGEVPPLIRKIFIKTLPKFLFMNLPRNAGEDHGEIPAEDEVGGGIDLVQYENPYKFGLHESASAAEIGESSAESLSHSRSFTRLVNENPHAHPQLSRALRGVHFIVKNLQGQDEGNFIDDEWKHLGMVMDRIMLWTYIIICTFGTIGEMMTAPTHFQDYVPVKGIEE